MINYNGNFKDHYFGDFTNRAFLYGDSVFETIKVVNNKIMFWEEHYLRLMSSMRILRINIPPFYTPDFFENQIIKTIINLDKYFSGNEAFVKVYYIKINTIEVSEGAKVVSSPIIKQYELELKAKEGGEITTQVDTKILTVKSVTGGKVRVYGTTKSQNIKINTGGFYAGQDLKAESSKIEIKAGGKAEIKSNDFTEVKILAGGILTIYGTPKEVKGSTIIGGKIYYKEE